MAQVVIEDLEPVVIEKLEALARKNGRSLQAEVKYILETVVQGQAINSGDANTVTKTPEELGWPPGFFERTAGRWEGEPLIRGEQGEYEQRLWELL
jgi:plasmid stability protein